MNTSSRSRIVLSLASALALFALSAHAEEPQQKPPGKPAVQAPRPGPGHPGPVSGHPGPAPGHPGPAVGRGPQDGHFAHGSLPARNFGGHPYRGRASWEGGRWHHEMRNGRDGWWWDVGGVWYYYPQPMEGPPAYVSEDFVEDDMARPSRETTPRRPVPTHRRRHPRRPIRAPAPSEAPSWAGCSAAC